MQTLSLKRQVRAAIAAGNSALAQQLIQANPVEYSERDIYLAVCAAVRAGDVRMFQYFFYRNGNGTDEQRLCAAVALMLAVKHERPAIVRSLADSGRWSAMVRPYKRHCFNEIVADRWINSPELVEIAYRRNDVEMMRLLIELGFKAEFRNYDVCEALLQDAYRNRDIDTLGLLWKLGYHACSKTQAETLLDAYQNRDIETFRGLVSLGYWSAEVERAICTDGDLARFAILFKAIRWVTTNVCGLVSTYPELLKVLRASGTDRIADFVSVMMQPENWPRKDKTKRDHTPFVQFINSNINIEIKSSDCDYCAETRCRFCDTTFEFGDACFGVCHAICILRADREHAVSSRSWSNQELFIAARDLRFEEVLKLIRDKEAPSQVAKYEQEYHRRALLVSVLCEIIRPGYAGLFFST